MKPCDYNDIENWTDAKVIDEFNKIERTYLALKKRLTKIHNILCYDNTLTSTNFNIVSNSYDTLTFRYDI